MQSQEKQDEEANAFYLEAQRVLKSLLDKRKFVLSLTKVIS